MRVAHILRKYNPAEWGGTETAVKQLLDGLKQRGVAGTMYCPRTEQPITRDPFTEEGHTVKRYRAFVPVFNLAEEQRNQLIAIGGNLMSFDLLGGLLRERNLSLIHAHALNRIGGIALTAARLRKLPFVVTIHGGVLDLPKSVQQTLRAPLEGGYEWGKFFGAIFRSRDVLKQANAIVTCNPREAALQKEKFPNKRVVVQPHGVPVAKYQQDCRAAVLDAFPTLASRKIILIVGRVDPVKNQGWVLVQMPRILRKHPDAVLVLAGACTDELYGKALRKEVRRLGIEDKVLFVGGLPPADKRLIGLMQQSSVVIVPSLSETFGLIILEAWAAGAPVLSTDTSGAKSLVQEGENGHLFNLEETERFHHLVQKTLDSPVHARELAQRGHELATQEYDTLVLSGRMKSLYEELSQARP
ncbi:MAG TPA: glycosyltransferase family 4 protein [Verrucomicrobiae bacterium]|jgi:glycosyltransferase involved in cell wall biosynthesis|nr:glycosyltransferase family 4 protein [Verrucomicrobiae bacterium]